MANTRRSKPEILALISTNGIGGISAQDHRDAIVTMMGGFACIHVQDGSTAQSGITTAEVMTGWAANGTVTDGLIPDFANNEITIDVDGVYMVNFQNSFSGGANVTFQFHLSTDTGGGYVEDPEGCHRKMSAGGDVGSAGFVAIKSLSAGDKLAVFVEADSSASMTPLDAQFIVHQVG